MTEPIVTKSLCPVCYGVIDATIITLDNVWMEKTCPEHGYFRGMVERDPAWYHFCEPLRGRKLYDGYYIDITDRCNISCKYCYHRPDSGSKDRDLADIIKEAETYKRHAPFILMGGEPTLHPDLPVIIKMMRGNGGLCLVSNGIRLCDEQYLNTLIESGLMEADNLLSIALSYHPESKGKDIEFLNFCKSKGFRIKSLLFTIDDLGQIDLALSIAENFRDILETVRIRAAAPVGSDWSRRAKMNTIFVSDIIKYLDDRAPTKIMEGFNNRSFFGCIEHNGLQIRAVSWYAALNFDLNDLNGAPFYMASDGFVYPFMMRLVLDQRKSS